MKDRQAEILRQRRMYAATISLDEVRGRVAKQARKKISTTRSAQQNIFQDNKLMHITFGEHITAAK